jgi:lactate dehydrogenase-like 2-hydroxyacid dehydrogenase
VVDLASPRAAWRIDERSVAAIRSGLGAGWDVVEVRAPAPSDGDGGPGSAESIAAARGAEIYLGYGVPAGVVEAGRTSLRWVHTGAAGVGSSLPQLRGTNIVLTNSAGVHAEPMADWVIAAIAYFARGLDRMVEAQALGRWAKDEFTDLTLPVRELRDLRVGILGLGGIGQAGGPWRSGCRWRACGGAPPGAGRRGCAGWACWTSCSGSPPRATPS